MSDLYRDPLVHVHDRIAELRLRIADLTSRLPAEFFSHHPNAKAKLAELGKTIAARSAKDRNDVDFLELEHALADQLRLLESLHEKVPGFEADRSRVDPGRPPAQPHTLSFATGSHAESEESARRERATLARAMRRVDSRAKLTIDSVGRSRVFVVALDVEGTPLMYTGSLAARGPDYAILDSSVAAYTSLNAPKIVAEPRGFFESVARALRVGSDATTGNEEFDRAFVVQADASPRAFLAKNVQDALLDLAACAPCLRIDDGIVRLTWSYELTPRTIEDQLLAAIRCVVQMRASTRTDVKSR